VKSFTKTDRFRKVPWLSKSCDDRCIMDRVSAVFPQPTKSLCDERSRTCADPEGPYSSRRASLSWECFLSPDVNFPAAIPDRIRARIIAGNVRSSRRSPRYRGKMRILLNGMSWFSRRKRQLLIKAQEREIIPGFYYNRERRRNNLAWIRRPPGMIFPRLEIISIDCPSKNECRCFAVNRRSLPDWGVHGMQRKPLY
jgi:hypothetical protein